MTNKKANLPVDIVEFIKIIKSCSHAAIQYYASVGERLDAVISIFQSSVGNENGIRERIAKITSRDSGERCAFPSQEPITNTYDAVPVLNLPIVIASDGSQIYPDKSSDVLFALISCGGIVKGDRPEYREVRNGGRLLIGEDVFPNNQLISERDVSLIRDCDERGFILNEAVQIQAESLRNTGKVKPIVGLFDGPIELFHEGVYGDRQNQWFVHYIETLKQIAERNIILGGYVDSPLASPVVRTLELMTIPENNLTSIRNYHPFYGVHDTDLFDSVLMPGERSSIFQLVSSSARSYAPPVSIYFFYLKVGNHRDHSIARIEVPEYVVQNEEMTNLLHWSILKDVQPGIPYPYLLLRAHEIVAISQESRSELENILRSQFIRMGKLPRGASAKWIAKRILNQ